MATNNVSDPASFTEFECRASICPFRRCSMSIVRRVRVPVGALVAGPRRNSLRIRHTHTHTQRARGTVGSNSTNCGLLPTVESKRIRKKTYIHRGNRPVELSRGPRIGFQCKSADNECRPARVARTPSGVSYQTLARVPADAYVSDTPFPIGGRDPEMARRRDSSSGRQTA